MTILQKQIAHYCPLITEIVDSSESRYLFTSQAYFETLVRDRKFADVNRIYVLEIISRLHATALITLRRNLSWIEAVETSYEQSAFFAFCSSLRGMIESSADSFFSLRYVPKNLASHFYLLASCIAGAESTKWHIFKEMEDWGIHFLEAGKYEDVSLNKDHYKAKKTWEYINSIDSDPFFGKVYPFYQKLCQIIHPSRESTYLYFSKANDHWMVQPFDFRSRVSQLLRMPEVDYAAIFQGSFNLALITIWIIDQFCVTGMRCPKVRMVNFESIGGFKEIKDMMLKSPWPGVH